MGEHSLSFLILSQSSFACPVGSSRWSSVKDKEKTRAHILSPCEAGEAFRDPKAFATRHVLTLVLLIVERRQHLRIDRVPDSHVPEVACG